jgi:hypothetical protein
MHHRPKVKCGRFGHSIQDMLQMICLGVWQSGGASGCEMGELLEVKEWSEGGPFGRPIVGPLTPNLGVCIIRDHFVKGGGLFC